MPEVYQRFGDKISPEPNSGCWLWTGATQRYGVFRLGGKNYYAHRFSYQMHNGDIPDGMLVCHKCDTPSCVNPDHLWLGTAKENMQDAVSKKRHAAGERNGRAKLKKPDIPRIKSLSRKGISQKDIAARFGVSHQLVSRIVANQAWING